MTGSEEEETYSTIFTPLKHPIRRRVLRILSGGPQSFSELQRVFKIESSHLTYHLEGLGNLLLKTEDGKYGLSSLGEAAVSMMRQVEEPPKTPLQFRFPSRKWKLLLGALLIGMVLLSTLFYLEYQGLSAQYSTLREEQGLLEQVLRDAFYLKEVILTREYTANGTVATSLASNMTVGVISLDGTYPNDLNETFVGNETLKVMEYPWGRSSHAYGVYSLTGNSTLEIRISFSQPIPPQAYLSVQVLHETIVNNEGIDVYPTQAIEENGTIFNETQTSGNWSVRVVYPVYLTSTELVWQTRTANSSTFLVPLQKKGPYLIQIEAPSVWNSTDHYDVDYEVALQMKSQGSYVPFFAGNRDDDYYLLSRIGSDNPVQYLYGDP